MLKRWFIRCFFLGLLGLCLGAWGWGHSHVDNLEINYRGWFLGCVTGDGEALVALGNDGTPNRFETNDMGPSSWNPTEFFSAISGSHIFHGFIFGMYPGGYSGGVVGGYLGVPHWFLAGALTVICIYAWRKTRRAANPSRAFPVEINKESTTPVGPLTQELSEMG